MARSCNFFGINQSDLNAMWAADAVVEHCEVEARTVNYAGVRAKFGRDNGLWGSLNRGRAILDTTDKLDQYLYSYSPMICRQWKHVLREVAPREAPTALVDYGCGQGLAGLLVRDTCGEAYFYGLRKVLLIEPSPVGLVRAAAIYRAMVPEAEIVGVCGKLDDVEEVRFAYAPEGLTLHLFSNVPDIEGFNQYAVLDKALTNGRHELLAVSPHRDFEGGSDRFHGLKDVLEDDSFKPWLTVETSKMERFSASPPDGQPAIYWHSKLKVSK